MGDLGGSAMGPVDLFFVVVFGVLSLLRPDCARTVAPLMASSTKAINSRPLPGRKARKAISAVMRRLEELGSRCVRLVARCPILSTPVRPEADVCLVFYVYAGDL